MLRSRHSRPSVRIEGHDLTFERPRAARRVSGDGRIASAPGLAPTSRSARNPSRERSRRGRRPVLVPEPLRRGDLVGVVASGFAVDRTAVEAGVAELDRMGLRVRIGRAVYRRDGYLAGSDASRLQDLVTMLEDDEVRAIHFARGGWGASRFLDVVPWKLMARHPKLMIGYSDLTAIFAPALDRCRLSSVYGPLVTELGNPRKFDRASLARAYFHTRQPFAISFSARSVLLPGSAVGPAVGGCLTLLTHLTGTRYAPDLRGAILLIEEVGEAPYRLDRMLTQLRLAGMLDHLAGVLVGSLTGCKPPAGARRSPTARHVITESFRPLGIPVVSGLRFGHIDRKLSLPLGVEVHIDTRRGRIVFNP